MEIMIGKWHVAGEGPAIEQEDLMSLTRQQHSGGRAGAASADNNSVIHFGASPKTVGVEQKALFWMWWATAIRFFSWTNITTFLGLAVRFLTVSFGFESCGRKDPELKTNLEIVRSIYAGNAEQIARNLQAALAPRFEWTEAAGFPYAGTYHTLEEVGKHVFTRLATEWEGYRTADERFYDAGETIVATGRYLGTYKKSGGVMDAVFAHLWTFQDGKIVRYVQNVDTKKVWDAMEGK
jgi:ketosteroid isomerase-like protein